MRWGRASGRSGVKTASYPILKNSSKPLPSNPSHKCEKSCKLPKIRTAGDLPKCPPDFYRDLYAGAARGIRTPIHRYEGRGGAREGLRLYRGPSSGPRTKAYCAAKSSWPLITCRRSAAIISSRKRMMSASVCVSDQARAVFWIQQPCDRRGEAVCPTSAKPVSRRPTTAGPPSNLATYCLARKQVTGRAAAA